MVRAGTFGRVAQQRLVAVLLAALLLLPVASAARPGAGMARAAGRTVDVIVRAVNHVAARDAVSRHGGRVTADLPIVDGVGAVVPASELPALRAEAGIRDISPNVPVHVQGKPVKGSSRTATAVYPYVVGADKLWKEKVKGSGVTVGVIDTGITPVNDLAGRVLGGVDFSGEDAPLQDSFGHGTFVAGVIAGNGADSGGKYTGVAPKANLVSIKIAGRDGASDVTHVLAALQWAVSFKNAYGPNGINVLNLSFGTDSTQPYGLSPMNYAVEKAWDAGMVVVVSASNRGPGAGTVTKPGDDPLVITTGAVDDLGTVPKWDDVMAFFSGQGPTASDHLNKPDVVAPGRSLVSLRAPGSKVDAAYPASRVGTAYFKGSGTSFSTAVVSGSAALLLNREPALTPDQVKYRLMSTATNGPAGDPNIDGDGSLATYAAAHAGTTTSANQGVIRSLGTGTVQADRGTLNVQIDADPLLHTLTLLTGELTAQNKPFNDLEYTTTHWDGTSWYTSQWYGTSWYGTSWYGTSWYGTSWYGTSWYGTSWYAGGWE